MKNWDKVKYENISKTYDKSLIGQVYETKDGNYKYEVMCYGYQKSTKIFYQVKFYINGYITFATKSSITRGAVSNPYIESYMDMFAYGIPNTEVVNYTKLRQRWEKMIARCYKKDIYSYNYSGGRGVKVDLRWHTLEYFIEDVTSFRTYHPALFKNGLVHLDKDYYQQDMTDLTKVKYSKDTCQWLWGIFNISFAKKRTPKIILTSLRHGNVYLGMKPKDLFKRTKYTLAEFTELYNLAKIQTDRNYVKRGNWKIETTDNEWYKERDRAKRMEELGI